LRRFGANLTGSRRDLKPNRILEVMIAAVSAGVTGRRLFRSVAIQEKNLGVDRPS
jgi:hypothetical protein